MIRKIGKEKFEMDPATGAIDGSVFKPKKKTRRTKNDEWKRKKDTTGWPKKDSE